MYVSVCVRAVVCVDARARACVGASVWVRVCVGAYSVWGLRKAWVRVCEVMLVMYMFAYMYPRV
jgi:hypothetical protein